MPLETTPSNDSTDMLLQLTDLLLEVARRRRTARRRFGAASVTCHSSERQDRHLYVCKPVHIMQLAFDSSVVQARYVSEYGCLQANTIDEAVYIVPGGQGSFRPDSLGQVVAKGFVQRTRRAVSSAGRIWFTYPATLRTRDTSR